MELFTLIPIGMFLFCVHEVWVYSKQTPARFKKIELHFDNMADLMICGDDKEIRQRIDCRKEQIETYREIVKYWQSKYLHVILKDKLQSLSRQK